MNKNESQILLRRKEIEKELEELLKETESEFTLADIQRIIYEEEGADDLTQIVRMFDDGERDMVEMADILDLINDAWNYFPHGILGGLSPAEKLQKKG